MTCSPMCVSSSAVGSSAKTTCGRWAMARAMATRCCSPPESSCGRWCMRARRPTCARHSSARRPGARAVEARHAQGELHVLERGHRGDEGQGLEDETHGAAARVLSRLASEAAEISSPSSETVPRWAVSSAPRRLRSVVLPDPEGPRSTVSRARGTWRVTSRRTWTVPAGAGEIAAQAHALDYHVHAGENSIRSRGR